MIPMENGLVSGGETCPIFRPGHVALEVAARKTREVPVRRSGPPDGSSPGLGMSGPATPKRIEK